MFRFITYVVSQYKNIQLKSTSKERHNQKGIAIMMAVFFVSLMSFMIFQISKETLYVSIVSSQDVRELKAYYAAKAGLDISLLRIKAYQKIKQQIDQAGEVAKPYAQRADIIWQFPFVWPPVIPGDDNEASLVVQSQLDTILEETFLKKVEYAPSIEDMGAKINLNNLASPSPELAQTTKEQIMEVFRKKLRDEEDFSDKYVIDEIERIIDNITDWIDMNTDSVRGGGENAFYADRGVENFPPNQNFKTKNEMLLVEGMTSEIYQVLDQVSTVFGNPAININRANKQVLLSLDPNMTEEVVGELIKRRNDPEHGPFSEGLFQGFIEEMLGSYAAFNPSGIPLSFSAAANFKIESLGSSGHMTKTITAYVLDQGAILDEYIANLKARDESQGNNNNSNNKFNNSNKNPRSTNDPPNNQQGSQNKTSRPLPSGPPPIIFLKVT